MPRPRRKIIAEDILNRPTRLTAAQQPRKAKAQHAAGKGIRNPAAPPSRNMNMLKEGRKKPGAKRQPPGQRDTVAPPVLSETKRTAEYSAFTQDNELENSLIKAAASDSRFHSSTSAYPYNTEN